jgi:hypothetical protein
MRVRVSASAPSGSELVALLLEALSDSLYHSSTAPLQLLYLSDSLYHASTAPLSECLYFEYSQSRAALSANEKSDGQ